MNIRTAKKPEARMEVGYNSSFKFQTYGVDNLYPQHLIAITSASGTAQLCLRRYATFVEGMGFADENIKDLVINRKGETWDSLLRLCVSDLTKFGGFALHVNYNVLCEVTEIQHVPFEQCRLADEDSDGYVGEILVHADWTGRKKRNSDTLRVEEKNIRRYNVFNSDPNVIMSQIVACGGIDKYNGQILWVSSAGGMNYPLPIYDSVVTEMSTDEGLSNVKCRNVRNNFLTSCMVIAKKSLDVEGNEREMLNPESLAKFQGDQNANKMMYIEIENDEDEPKVVELPVKNYDKDFTVTDESTVERIYAQFGQEAFYAIRMGKFGFSGTLIADAYSLYASMVTNEQRLIQRTFECINALYVGRVSDDFSILPLKYIVNGASN